MTRDSDTRGNFDSAAGSVRLDRALDRFIGDMARRNFTPRSRDAYYRHLSRLLDGLSADATVAHVTPDAIRTCLDGWADASASTRYKVDSMFRAFSRWLYVNELADRNPMDRIPRPKRTAPDEAPLRAISGADVRRLFDACKTTREFLCLATIAYLGSRRGAASQLRWRDVDLDEGWATLNEKGGKVHVVALPNPYLALLRELIRAGAVTPSPDDYVVPMVREQRRSGNRDDRVIWRIVKDIGKRAGVPQVFPHALRHSFSVRFLEQHPGEIEALQRLLGHARMETTQRYLRAMEHQRLLDRVRDLSWDTRFEDKPLKARTGFEPVYEALQASA
jgi:integrase/recombinase XerD